MDVENHSIPTDVSYLDLVQVERSHDSRKLSIKLKLVV